MRRDRARRAPYPAADGVDVLRLLGKRNELARRERSPAADGSSGSTPRRRRWSAFQREGRLSIPASVDRSKWPRSSVRVMRDGENVLHFIAEEQSCPPPCFLLTSRRTGRDGSVPRRRRRRRKQPFYGRPDGEQARAVAVTSHEGATKTLEVPASLRARIRFAVHVVQQNAEIVTFEPRDEVELAHRVELGSDLDQDFVAEHLAVDAVDSPNSPRLTSAIAHRRRLSIALRTARNWTQFGKPVRRSCSM